MLNPTTIAITGVTGLLGRNILFEYCQQYKNNLYDLKLILFGRSCLNNTLKNRVIQTINTDGRYYLSIHDSELASLINYFENEVTYINIDLVHKNLNIDCNDYDYLIKQPIDVFYHSAALTNLDNNNTIEKAIHETNIGGTEAILNLLKNCKLKRFCHFSSAYSTGNIDDTIFPDDCSMERSFRNPYEFSKLYSEILVRNFEHLTKVECYIFRTSILSGRLIEPQKGQIHKFDVFYGWTAFFVKIKQLILKNGDDIYNTPLNIDIRFVGNKNAAINIIPADYAAKATIQIMSLPEIHYKSFHLVNPIEKQIIEPVFEYLNITGYDFVEQMPDSLNKIETFYYKSAGNIFNAYMQNNGEMLFDNSSLIKTLSSDMVCPEISKENFTTLLTFAKENNFGLRNI
jgi:thioester reductase-like protein